MRIAFIPLLAAAAVLSLAQEPSVATAEAPANLAIPAQLNTTIRADKAHVGDLVRFKTIEPVLVGKGVIIPSNAHLYGHVLGAAPKQAQTPSWISVVVDRVEWKEHRLLLHAFISGQVIASRPQPSGAPGPLPQDSLYPAGAPHNSPGGGRRRNLGDPRSAVAMSRAQNDTTWDQGPMSHPTGLGDVKLARHKSGTTFLFCQKHNLKIPSGVLFMLQNMPPQMGPPSARPAVNQEPGTAPD